VEFIVYDSNTSLARLVVEVKRRDKLQEGGSMLQLMAETIVVALKDAAALGKDAAALGKDAAALGKDAVVWGALTDVFRWCELRAAPQPAPLTDLPAGCRHFIKVTATPDASKQGGFAVTVERFKSSTLFHVGTGGFSETGSTTLSTLWNVIFPGARAHARSLVLAAATR
jgi:hypothetical protein